MSDNFGSIEAAVAAVRAAATEAPAEAAPEAPAQGEAPAAAPAPAEAKPAADQPEPETLEKLAGMMEAKKSERLAREAETAKEAKISALEAKIAALEGRQAPSGPAIPVQALREQRTKALREAGFSGHEIAMLMREMSAEILDPDGTDARTEITKLRGDLEADRKAREDSDKARTQAEQQRTRHQVVSDFHGFLSPDRAPYADAIWTPEEKYAQGEAAATYLQALERDVTWPAVAVIVEATAKAKFDETAAKVAKKSGASGASEKRNGASAPNGKAARAAAPTLTNDLAGEPAAGVPLSAEQREVEALRVARQALNQLRNAE